MFGLVGWSLLLVTILAWFGDRWWVLDLVAGFRPQLALVAAGVWLVSLGRGRRVWLGSALALVINGGLVAPVFFGPGPSSASPDLRIVSFNVLQQNENYQEVIEFVRHSDADVIFLHEGYEPWEQAVLEADLPYRVDIVRDPDLIFGTMVLTRGAAEVKSFGFRLDQPRAVEVKIDGVTVLGVHPLSPTNPERAAARTSSYRFYTDWVRQQEGPTIVVGDMNATPWSYPFRRLIADTGLNNSQLGYGLELSFPEHRNQLFQVSIDHLLYSDELVMVDRVLGDPLGSDHFPLTVDLAAAS